MKKDKKQVRTYCMGGIVFAAVLVVIIFILAACGIIPRGKGCAKTDTNVSSIKRAMSFENTNMKSDTITGYYLEICLAGVKANCPDMMEVEGYKRAFKGVLNPNGLKRADTTCTTLVTFVDVTVNFRPVFISDLFYMNVPASALLGDNVDFLSDTVTPIHEAYYNLLCKKGFVDNKYRSANVNLMLLVENDGHSLSPRGDSKVKGTKCFSIKCKVYKKEVPSDVNDPDSPNFQLPGGSGVNALPVIGVSFWSWFCSLPFWVQVVTWVVLILLVVGLLTSIFGLIFKKK